MATIYFLCFVLLFMEGYCKECSHVNKLNETYGIVRSHTGFGASLYPPGLNCTWILHHRVGYVLQLDTLVFNLQQTTRCDVDVLQIIDANQTWTFCGSIGPTNIITPKLLTIHFITNSPNRGLGFLLKYSYRPINRTCTDNAVLTIPGIVASPHYPLVYDNDCTCRWFVTAEIIKVVVIHIEYLHIEGEIKNGCPYDYLMFYDLVSGKSIDKLCGLVKNKTLITNSNHVLLEFVTDGQNTDTGFQLRWYAELPTHTSTLPVSSSKHSPITSPTIQKTSPATSQKSTASATPKTPTVPVVTSNSPLSQNGRINSSKCSQTIYLNGSSGYISLPLKDNHYLPNSICQWVITGVPDSAIVANFDFFRLEDSKECTSDSLTFYDGLNNTASRLETLCGTTLPASVVATSNALTIEFKSNEYKEDMGFIIHYVSFILVTETEAPPLHCPNNSITINSQFGSLASIGYNGVDSYSPNLNCKWQITTSPGKVLLLRFHDFETEFSSDCSYDYLMIKDENGSGRVLGQYCGIRQPRDVITSTNSVFLHFASDAAVNGIGFNLSYSTINPVAICSKDEFRCINGLCINRTLLCDHTADCSDSSDELICDTKTTCGEPPIKATLEDHRIVGGEEAVRGSWPWQTSVSHKGIHQCGGTLLNPYWVITAAHCFQRNDLPREWKVSVGKHYLKNIDHGVQNIEAQDIIIHPQYHPATSSNDIALIQLSVPANITDTVDVPCLPTRPVSSGQMCYITGWGDTLGTCCDGVLKQAMVPILNINVCNSSSHYNGRLLQSMFCAGYLTQHIDACHGDSGGPLVCQYPDSKWYLQGIISWGIGCADFKHPGIYTRIFHFISWIHQIIYQT